MKKLSILLSIYIIIMLTGCASTCMEYRSATTAARSEKNLKRAEEWGLLALESPECNPATNAYTPYFLATEVYLLQKNYSKMAKMLDIAEQMQDIIEQARAGRVAGEHLKGGTISISNIGAIGGITATPVINKPEAAIVALGKTQKLPRFDEEGNVSAQHIMAVNWSGDHRIIDGATMVRFNNLWMSYLTQPEKMLMHLR